MLRQVKLDWRLEFYNTLFLTYKHYFFILTPSFTCTFYKTCAGRLLTIIYSFFFQTNKMKASFFVFFKHLTPKTFGINSSYRSSDNEMLFLPILNLTTLYSTQKRSVLTFNKKLAKKKKLEKISTEYFLKFITTNVVHRTENNLNTTLSTNELHHIYYW